jgi:hypothetical protein
MLGSWLQIKVDAVDRKDLEVFAYLLRVLLTKIVEQAIRNRSANSQLN